MGLAERGDMGIKQREEVEEAAGVDWVSRACKVLMGSSKSELRYRCYTGGEGVAVRGEQGIKQREGGRGGSHKGWQVWDGGTSLFGSNISDDEVLC